MKLSLLLTLIVFSSSRAFSDSFTIEDVKEQKATMTIPTGSTLKVGDRVYTEPPAQVPQPEQPKKLRPRLHNIALSYDNAEDEIKTTSTTIKSENASLGFTYSYNLGYFQPGVSVGVGLRESGLDESSVSSTLFFLRGNLIKNEPGQDIIPFGMIGFGGYTEKEKDVDDGTDAKISGSIGSAGIGVTWYPFSELFAFEARYTVHTGDLKWTGTPTVTGDIEVQRSILSISAVLSF